MLYPAPAQSVPGRALDGGNFPPLLLTTHPLDIVHCHLYSEFQRWQAPWLLALPVLDRQTRERLEDEARARPLVVAQQYRLYPEIIDTTAIRAARVEAMLRGSGPEGRNNDSALSTFYIELHPSQTA